jgi:hypothetical protein
VQENLENSTLLVVSTKAWDEPVSSQEAVAFMRATICCMGAWWSNRVKLEGGLLGAVSSGLGSQTY